jgi:Pyruvate/2-oxoacid:ferredoxin oxidoreductase delta subunit
MRYQARKPFDQSTIPNDLCPIATEYGSLRTGDWRAERPVVDRDKCVKCATCWVYCPTQCIVEKRRAVAFALRNVHIMRLSWLRS